MLKRVEKKEGERNTIICTVDENGVEQGPFEIRYKGGGYGKGTYKDGKLDGPCERYYSNGQLWVKCTYKDGNQDGPYETYYENGQLWEKCTYKDGKLDGPYEAYYDNGQLWVKCTYKDGKKDGPYESYYGNGQIKEKCTYKNGKRLEGEEARDYLRELEAEQKRLTEEKQWKEQQRYEELIERREVIAGLKGRLEMISDPVFRKPVGPARTPERQAKAEDITEIRRARTLLRRVAQKAYTDGDRELMKAVERVARPYAERAEKIQREFQQKRLARRAKSNRD